MTFSDLDLREEILRAITEKGYTKPTPIQSQAIPFVLTGKDLMAGSQTGTGKTAGFTLPLLEQLMRRKKQGEGIRALIVTPTRELALQIEENVKSYSKYLPLRSTVIFGGVGDGPQIARLRKGVDILIATPGRLLDLISQKVISLMQVEMFVLDEADRMLDMGFIHDIRKLLNLLPKKRQNLLFSATFAPEVKKLADSLLHSPHMIETTSRNSAAERVQQVVYPVDSARKKDLLAHLIALGSWKQVLVFTRTKHGANRLGAHLEQTGISNGVIHGNKSQGARTKALSDFKSGLSRVLVATDIAARGIDIDLLPIVVNFDLPSVPEDYIHRIGRTGRAGNEGKAISLVCIDEKHLLVSIEKLLKKPLPKEIIEEFKPDPSIPAKPIQQGRVHQKSFSTKKPSLGRQK